MSHSDAPVAGAPNASPAGPSTGENAGGQVSRYGELADRRFEMLIGGEWVSARDEQTFSCLDPFTEQAWGQVPLAGAEDVDRAVRAASEAFAEGSWRRTVPAQRAAMLRRLAELIESHAEELTVRQILENGKLITEMAPGAGVVAADCHFFAGLAETLHGYTVPSSLSDSVTFTLREPIGVVAAITPWNTPLGLLGWKLFPALAAGDTIVIKPSEVTPTSTLLLAELATEAGFPDGVINVVTGRGDTGAALVAHPLVDKIAFTGSTATGRRIAAAAAERMARVSLELGGKSPNIVFEDADLPGAVSGIMAGIFAASGQSCMAGSRVLVQDSVYDEVAQMLAARGSALRMGDPLDTSTEIGPVASHSQLEKILSFFDGRSADGAELVTGGARADRPGLFVEPTVFTNVDNDARLAREEIFGPVASLIRFRDEQDAIRVANDTQYGLAAGIWTEDLRRAHRMVGALRAGTVWVNNYRVIGHAMPFGGFKQSGLGRELGLEALHAYTEVKSVWIQTAETS